MSTKSDWQENNGQKTQRVLSEGADKLIPATDVRLMDPIHFVPGAGDPTERCIMFTGWRVDGAICEFTLDALLILNLLNLIQQFGGTQRCCHSRLPSSPSHPRDAGFSTSLHTIFPTTCRLLRGPRWHRRWLASHASGL